MDSSTTPKSIQDWLIKNGYAEEGADEAAFKSARMEALADGELTQQMIAQLLTGREPSKAAPSGKSGPTARQMFSGGPTVKAPSQNYSTEKTVAKHARTGRPVQDVDGLDVMTISQAERAKMGAFIKWRALQDHAIKASLSEHERSLVDEMLTTDVWCGEIDGENCKSIPGARVKTLISDSGSGGVDVNPLWFDQNLVTYPLLHSELLPMVDLIEMPRSATVVGASIGNPTVTWGETEGTSLTEFDTTALVGPINATVQNCMVALEIGRDMIADAAVDNLGGYVVENIGQRMLAEYDKVIAIGDGTTQPQGFSLASGISTVNASVNGVQNLCDIETLLFGLPLAYRRKPWNVAFICNDHAYQRARAMPRGADDAQRLLGPNEQEYSMLGVPVKIQNDLPVDKMFIGALKRYRLWRRLGQQIEFTNQGQTLRLKNTTLLTVRSRLAGKVIDGGSFVKLQNFGSPVWP